MSRIRSLALACALVVLAAGCTDELTRSDRKGDDGDEATAPVALGEECRALPSPDPIQLEPRPEQPAPVAGQPGQHALIAWSGGDAIGNVDLAPGGAFFAGRSEVSDAKTVYLVCMAEAAVRPTDERCSYVELTGARRNLDLTLDVSQMELAVIELASGEEVARVTIDRNVNIVCPDQAQPADMTQGRLETDKADPKAQVVAWVGQHLVGATYTP